MYAGDAALMATHPSNYMYVSKLKVQKLPADLEGATDFGMRIQDFSKFLHTKGSLKSQTLVAGHDQGCLWFFRCSKMVPYMACATS